MKSSEKHFLVRAVEASFMAAFATIVFIGTASAALTKPVPSLTISSPVLQVSGANAGSVTSWQIGKYVSVAWKEKALKGINRVVIRLIDVTDPTNVIKIADVPAIGTFYQTNGSSYTAPVTFARFKLAPLYTEAGGPLFIFNKQYRLSVSIYDKSGKLVIATAANPATDAQIVMVEPIHDVNAPVTVETPAIMISAPTSTQTVRFGKSFKFSFRANFQSRDGFSAVLLENDPRTGTPLQGAVPLNLASLLTTKNGLYSGSLKVASSTSFQLGKTYTLQVSAKVMSTGNTVVSSVSPIVPAK